MRAVLNFKRVALFFVFGAAVFFQFFYLEKRYGPLLLDEECPWCEQNTRSESVVYIPFNASHFRIVAPADPDLISSLLWMRIAYYFGSKTEDLKSYEHYLGLLDLVTDLSPQWETPYVYGAILLPLELGDIEGGVYIIDKGIQNLPRTWELWFFKGYYLWKSYGDIQSASEVIRKASMIKGSPSYLRSLSVTILSDETNRDMEGEYKKQVFETITEPIYKSILRMD